MQWVLSVVGSLRLTRWAWDEEVFSLECEAAWGSGEGGSPESDKSMRTACESLPLAVYSHSYWSLLGVTHMRKEMPGSARNIMLVFITFSAGRANANTVMRFTLAHIVHMSTHIGRTHCCWTLHLDTLMYVLKTHLITQSFYSVTLPPAFPFFHLLTNNMISQLFLLLFSLLSKRGKSRYTFTQLQKPLKIPYSHTEPIQHAFTCISCHSQILSPRNAIASGWACVSTFEEKKKSLRALNGLHIQRWLTP